MSRAHYFRPVLTLIEKEGGGYEAYLDFRQSYFESSVEGNPDEYEADDSNPGVVRAMESLDAWIRDHNDKDRDTEDALRFTI